MSDDSGLPPGSFHVSGYVWKGRVYLSLDLLRLSGEGETQEEAVGALVAEVRHRIDLRGSAPRFRNSGFWRERGPVLDYLQPLSDEQLRDLLDIRMGEEPEASLDPTPGQKRRRRGLLSGRGD